MEQILGFIFLPGFSTARTVSDISGRGVGMDAVKRAVDEMSGNVRVRSTPGAGTTVTISLPLTMAIITAVLVEVAGSTYAIPMSAVREILKETDSIAARRVGHAARDPAARRGPCAGQPRRRAPGRRRSRAPRRHPRRPPRRIVRRLPVVVVDFEGRKIGLEVERIHGTREVVIKSLSRHYREVDGLIGASILGNGKIALIVDVETMIGLPSRRDRSSWSSDRRSSRRSRGGRGDAARARPAVEGRCEPRSGACEPSRRAQPGPTPTQRPRRRR